MSKSKLKGEGGDGAYQDVIQRFSYLWQKDRLAQLTRAREEEDHEEANLVTARRPDL